MKDIKIVGAQENNLKNLHVDIPKNKITVVTGPSGSGKSSLIFDVLYNEAERRFLESISSTAKNFFKQTKTPEVKDIKNLTPALSLNQHTLYKNPISTVASVTEIMDFLRILFAKLAVFFCPQCHKKLNQGDILQSISAINLKKGDKVWILSTLVENKTGAFNTLIHKYRAQGYHYARLNKNFCELAEINLNNKKKNTLEVVIDRIIFNDDKQDRLIASVQTAIKSSDLNCSIVVERKEDLEKKEEFLVGSENFCFDCKKTFRKPTPALFSPNSPLGKCNTCQGKGFSYKIAPTLLIADTQKPLLKGGFTPLSASDPLLPYLLKTYFNKFKIPLDSTFSSLEEKHLNFLLENIEKKMSLEITVTSKKIKKKISFGGIKSYFQDLLEENFEKYFSKFKELIEKEECPSCHGHQIKPLGAHALFFERTLKELLSLNIEQSELFFKNIKLNKKEKLIGKKLIEEILQRLKFLKKIGVGYLHLNRQAVTLSGGETQRIRLANILSSDMGHLIYILDEPTIGLHLKDTKKLLSCLEDLKNNQNTIIIVEHDENVIKAADHILEIGPGAGVQGGELVFSGKIDKYKRFNSPTAKILFASSPSKKKKKSSGKKFLNITGINKNNIIQQKLKIPLNKLVVVTGVSGSGKSTLVHQVMVPAIKDFIGKKPFNSSFYKKVLSDLPIEKIIAVNQSPIGKTNKSNPATFSKVLDDIRQLFAATQEAKLMGLTPSHFSFNSSAGACEACSGHGVIVEEMLFLPDVKYRCPSCGGKRYKENVLQATYKNKNISDVLDLHINEAHAFFKNYPRMERKLAPLVQAGLSHIKLNQPTKSLSGGESQRLKLSRELGVKNDKHCIYIFDEPTTGLHFHEVDLLLTTLKLLISQGHSVIVIEHNDQIIQEADSIVEVGPGAGEKGGKIKSYC